MPAYIAKRLAMMIPVLLFLTAVIFVLSSVSPIDPARAVLGTGPRRSRWTACARRRGLNDPLPVQYVDYLGDVVLHGDLGTSARLRQPGNRGAG